MHPLTVSIITCLATAFAASLPTSESQAFIEPRQLDGLEDIEIQKVVEEAIGDVQLDGAKEFFFGQPSWKEDQLLRKAKREIGNTNGPESEETPESPDSPDAEPGETSTSSLEQQGEVSNELPPNMLALREQIAGTLLAQSGMLDLDKLRPIADEAVRRLMEEVAALGDEAKPPSSLVRLTPELMDTNENKFGDRMTSAIKDMAYKLAWANLFDEVENYVRDGLRSEFDIDDDTGDSEYYSSEAEELVAKEFKALEGDYDDRDEDGSLWTLTDSSPDTKQLIGRILQQTVKEGRARNLRADELENFMRGSYPTMAPNIRKRIATAARTLFNDERYLAKITRVQDWTFGRRIFDKDG